MASSSASSLEVTVQGRSVPLSWDESLSREKAQQVLDTFSPFKDWAKNISNEETEKVIKVQKVHLQSIDMFGPRIGFLKFKADVVNKDNQMVPGITFMRGGAVAVLVILKEEGSGAEHALLTVQPRVPIGTHAFPEIPAGMLDGSGKFVGVAAKELKEETGIEIKEDELVDLTHLAYGDKWPGMFPSPGGCDEYIKLFLYRQTVSPKYLHEIEGKLTGLIEEGETITLKVVPLDQLITQAPDAKTLASMALYLHLKEKGKVPPPAAAVSSSSS
eukprot:TRINITY_DN3075_c0_g1_i2.p1 TRINITY_DN3075_c0_g1~~TRINITY_DN3075_c0_g1_i2.p1  ORF type:complete len:298 (-),score=89.60 TRINITY_DN3075_c0_g1_i2:34-852(-)